MATSFRPANSPLQAPDVKVEEMTTPTTPRPTSAPESQSSKPAAAAAATTTTTTDDAATPTRASFGGALAAQKPLPNSPFPQAVQVPESSDQPKTQTPKRENSQHSRKSGDSDDVEMEESDGAADGAEEAAGGSDDESVNADGSRSNKKKKSQRFYCTDYPPCNLSFTRSEHLARHIRKHTGERPFQCHCSRRFSRLDNLRQHAQTVHVNEEIPMDSLAATGSRYQRQMRPDRVRPPTGRARASTAGSLNAPVRGHSKSLSTSSINSISSVASGFSPPRDDFRRRPAPLVMSNHNARLSTESYRSVADSTFSYGRQPSPSDYSAPTSAGLSTNQSSPRWSCMASPTTGSTAGAGHSRSQSMFTSNRERRLSVPSGGSPYQSPHGPPSGAYPPSSGNLLTPPQQSAWGDRRDSLTADDAYRRRTWHPDSRQFTAPTSTLNSVATSNQYQIDHPAPLAEPRPNAPTTIRLPGIESFDKVPGPSTPPRRAPSPMAVDTEMGNSPQYDIHRGLNRLDISKNSTPPRDGAGAWASEAERAVQVQAQQVQTAQAEQARLNPPTVRFEEAPPPPYAPQSAHPSSHTRAFHQHTMSAPSISTPREFKRHGWYNGPAESRAARVGRMEHPNIAAFTGFPAQKVQPQPQQPHHQQQQDRPAEPLSKLDALVAVAAHENQDAPPLRSHSTYVPGHPSRAF